MPTSAAGPRTDRRPAIRVLPPRLEALPRPAGTVGGESLLTADGPQREALARLAAGEGVLVHGAPGSGRTALALGAALAGPSGAILLAPRRRSAALLGDALAVHGADPSLRAMTPAALAYAIVREGARADGQGEPTLVTGADQDTLLAELIAAHENWHLELEPGAREMLAFRTQLRDAITRAMELRLAPADLSRLARERQRPAWADAAQILREYLDVLALESQLALDAGPRLDAGGIIRRAASLLERRPELVQPAALYVDDAQDLTPAGIDLIVALARPGVPLLVTTAPDASVESFRGALAAAGEQIALRRADALGPASGGLARVDLTERHRGGVGLHRAVDALRSRLPLAGAPARLRRPVEDPGAAGGEVSVLTLPSALDEARAIATALRDLHHRAGAPYDEMAVICRSGSAVDALADLLARHDLPVSTTTRLRPLREEQVVLDLLRLAEIGAEPAAMLGAEEALALLRGPFGDTDSLRLRRIRRLLRAADPQSAATSAEMLAEVLCGKRDLPSAADRAAAPVQRVAGMIAAVRGLGTAPAPIDALWAAWDAAGLAEGWRHAALDAREADGARARLTARRLDAVTALFASAERFTERRPAADAAVFIDHVRSQAIAEDTLAARTAPAGRVAVLTPAQIAGEERETVVLAGMQEGGWPNLTLRSSLFGAADLSLLHEHPDLPHEPAALRAIQREEVLAGEIRMAVSALARARSAVLVTAVEDSQHAPSALHAAIADAADIDPERGGGWFTAEDARTDPGPAPDARSLVSALRRRAQSADEAERAHAARLLVRIDDAGAPGADPATWYHQPVSTMAPLLAETAEGEPPPLALSPSALERAHACPQAWLLERAGGTGGSGAAQLIGTAIHRIAQEHPDGHVPDLLGRLHELLRPLRLESTWSGRQQLRHAETAARSLSAHLQASPPAHAVEAPFAVDVGPVRLRGVIDRIEGDEAGLRVVDLKTGRNAKSAREAAEDLQLAAYQTAVDAGALDEQLGNGAAARLNGAQLVYVGTGTKKAAVRLQPPLQRAEHPTWFRELVKDVARSVSGPVVRAVPNAHCTRCPVKRSCGIWPEGEQL